MMKGRKSVCLFIQWHCCDRVGSPVALAVVDYVGGSGGTGLSSTIHSVYAAPADVTVTRAHT